MDKNIKRIFLLTTVMMLLLTVSAISATDTDNTQIVSDSQQLSQDSLNVEQEVQTVDNKDYKNIKQDSQTHIVTNDNVDEIFGADGYTLSEQVQENDTLDFQGTIDKEHSLVINKPVKVISSTQDAIISLHTVAGSLMGEDPGNSFVVNHGGSGSYISQLYLNNTECWIHNVENAYFYNMTMHVENAKVGSGVGQTSVRYCNNVTMDSCHIYTENNGGSSSFVWTSTSNSTIINSTVEGVGNVGNLLYVGNIYNINDKPSNYTIANFDNNIINCTISGGSGGISNPLQNMATRTLIKGNKFYSGGSASAGTNGTMIDNEFYKTVNVAITANCVASGNIHYGNGTTTIQANAIVENNTFYSATISAKNVTFNNNTVKNILTLSQPVNIDSCTLKEITVNANAKETNITNNNITGTITLKSTGVTIENNTFDSLNDYTITVTTSNNTIINNVLLTTVKAGLDTISNTGTNTIENNTPESGSTFELTDDTYSQYFDENAKLINENVTTYSTLILNGEFNNKSFDIDNVKLTLQGNNAVINNGYIKSSENATVVVENIKFNNTDSVENSVIFDSDKNVLRNVELYRTSTAGISREVLVNGNQNKIVSNKFNLSVPVENIDYSNYPFAISNVSAVTVTGSSNNISSNTVNLINTTEGYGTISVIDIASKTSSKDNIINSNTINANSTGYLYGINLGANTGYNTITSNKITLNSGYYTAGIQIGYSPAYNNTINSNNLNLTSQISYGILASAYGSEVSGTIINSNNINITANQLAAIELCGSTPELIKDTTMTSNKIIADGNYTIGIAVAGSNIQLVTNNITVTGTTNSSDESSYDIIKPTTAALILKDSMNITAYNNTMDVVNGADIILNNTNNTIIVSTLTTATRFINTQNNANIMLSNSNNNLIDTQKAYTTGVYSIELTNSSNNNITNNNLNASNLKGGDDAVLMDENSVNNYLYNNTARFGLLTDETYSQFFDENSQYKYPEGISILTLAGDLYNKDLVFTNNLTFVNTNYTIYNGTIIVSDLEDANYTDRFVIFNNININNTGKSAFIDNLSVYKQRNIQFNGGQFTVNGDNITAFDSTHPNATYTVLTVKNASIYMEGGNITAFNMTRDTYARYDYIDVETSNITLKATDNNVAFDVYNTNLDILTNNIVQTGGNISTLTAQYVYANGQFFMTNTIEADGDNIQLITLKDNYGSNPTFGNNIITATSSNPVSVMNISNATNVYVGQGQYTYSSYNKPNTIIVNADNGETPVVYISQRGYVRNNFIMSNDLYGDEAVDAATVSNITPFRTIVEIDAPNEFSTGDEVTITANAVNKTGTSVDGTMQLYIDGEVVAQSETSSISYTFTPTDANVNITAVYTNTSTKYVSSTNQTNLVNPKAVVVQLDDTQAVAGDAITLNATLKDAYGNNITGGKVVFKVNGVTVKDANGKAIYVKVVDGVAVIENYTISEKWAGQTLNISVVYSGCSKYESQRYNTTLEVSEASSSFEFTTKDITAQKNESVELSVKVDSNVGKVVFKVNGKTVKDANGKVIYAKVSNGIASVSYTVPSSYKLKTYTVTAVYLYNSERQETNTTLTVVE